MTLGFAVNIEIQYLLSNIGKQFYIKLGVRILEWNSKRRLKYQSYYCKTMMSVKAVKTILKKGYMLVSEDISFFESISVDANLNNEWQNDMD